MLFATRAEADAWLDANVDELRNSIGVDISYGVVEMADVNMQANSPVYKLVQAYELRCTFLKQQLKAQLYAKDMDMDKVQMLEMYLNNEKDELLDVAADMDADNDTIEAAAEYLFRTTEPKVSTYEKVMNSIKSISWMRINFILLWGLLGLYLVGLMHRAYLADGWDGVVMLTLLCGFGWGVMHLIFKNGELSYTVKHLEAELKKECRRCTTTTEVPF